MDKKEYQNLLAPIPTGVLDGLRKLVEFVDHVLTQEHRKDIRLKEDTFWFDSGFNDTAFGEVMGDQSHKGAKDVQRASKDNWQIFSDDGKGALQLNYENYAAFKSALKEVLPQQPFGYKRVLENPRIKSQVAVVTKDEVVYVQFDDERPIRIADATNNQGKLLRLLGNPIGNSRTVDTVAEELGAQDGSDAQIKYAMKEIQRKLAARGKRGALRLVFDERSVWLEAE